jgi:hypothetical protein
VVLLLSFGYMHAYFQKNPAESAPPAHEAHDFGSPEVFVPQKTVALKRFKMLAAAGAACFGLVSLLVLLWLLLR